RLHPLAGERVPASLATTRKFDFTGIDMNLIDFFDKSARLHPNRIDAVFEDRQWRYNEVQDLAIRIGNGLRSSGVLADTKCAVLSRNDPIAFISMLGILKAQGVWVPLNPGNAKDQSLH